MPAVQMHPNGDQTEPVAAEAGDLDADGTDDAAPTVNDHLEMALSVAAEQNMSTSELMGIFFYYAHSIAESYRQEAIANQLPE